MGFNSFKACSSVNHLHFQIYNLPKNLENTTLLQSQIQALPTQNLIDTSFQLLQADLTSTDYLFNFFLLKFPIDSSVEIKSEKIFAIIHILNTRAIPYNLLFHGEDFFIIPR